MSLKFHAVKHGVDVGYASGHVMPLCVYVFCYLIVVLVLLFVQIVFFLFNYYGFGIFFS